MPWYLKSDAGDVLVLREGQAVLGKRPQADLEIDEPGLLPRHAAFYRNGDTFWIADLTQGQGTLVNGLRPPPQVWHPLRAGDVVELGEAVRLQVFRREG